MTCEAPSQKSFFQRFYPIDQELPDRVLTGIGCGVALHGMQKFISTMLPQGSDPEAFREFAQKQVVPRSTKFSTRTIPLRPLVGVVKQVVLAPVIEEALFRGVYAENQRSRGGSDETSQRVANYVENSALFTAGHYDFRSSFRNFARRAPLIFASGVALSYIAEKSGTLFEATVAHSVSNALNLFALRKAK